MTFVAVVAMALVFSSSYFGMNGISEQWAIMNDPTAVSASFEPRVRGAILCLRERRATTYRAVGSLRQDAGFYQRLNEGAWPIQNRESSSTLLFSSVELEGLYRSYCKSLIVQCNKEGVVLASCSF